MVTPNTRDSSIAGPLMEEVTLGLERIRDESRIREGIQGNIAPFMPQCIRHKRTGFCRHDL